MDSTQNKYKHIISSLPTIPKSNGLELCLFQDFWTTSDHVDAMLPAIDHFKPEPSDIFLCTLPKSGTTWLKALGAAIFTRKHLHDPSHPLFTKLSHEIVPFLEFDLFPEPVRDRHPEIPLLCTHMPYSILPKSIVESDCKLIYLCRDPKDLFASTWHFEHVFTNTEIDMAKLDEDLEMYCKGTHLFGPFWDHILGYWKASLEFPEKVMFVKYEDLKDDTASYVRKMAEFVGCPMRREEEEERVVEKIVEMCSFKNMVNVNTSGEYILGKDLLTLERKSFFRKGEKGDWKNLLTEEMAAKLDNVIRNKFMGSGLSFDTV